jgi:hypothetical protein
MNTLNHNLENNETPEGQLAENPEGSSIGTWPDDLAHRKDCLPLTFTLNRKREREQRAQRGQKRIIRGVYDSSKLLTCMLLITVAVSFSMNVWSSAELSSGKMEIRFTSF